MRTKWTIAIDGRATRVEEKQKWWETMMVEGPGRTRGERWMDPGGKGMQDIAAPRDTRGRNLHDGTGDVLQIPQSSNHEVTRGFHVWMAHSPWLVFRKISIYSDYRFSSCTLLVFSPFPGGLQAYRQSEFYPCSLPPIRMLGSAEQRFHFLLEIKMVGFEIARRRNTSCVADFFHYDSWSQFTTLTLSFRV